MGIEVYKIYIIVSPGTKRKHKLCGRLLDYFLEKESCLTLISSMKSTEKINFTELARKVNLKNIIS